MVSLPVSSAYPGLSTPSPVTSRLSSYTPAARVMLTSRARRCDDTTSGGRTDLIGSSSSSVRRRGSLDDDARRTNPFCTSPFSLLAVPPFTRRPSEPHTPGVHYRRSSHTNHSHPYNLKSLAATLFSVAKGTGLLFVQNNTTTTTVLRPLYMSVCVSGTSS